MKKVVHFIITDVFSGAESVAAHIIKDLPDGWVGYYAAPQGQGIERAKAMGIKTVVCNTCRISDIKRVYKEIAPDAVHAHDPRMSFLCALAGIPFISHVHNNSPWHKKLCLNSLAMQFMCRKAKKVFCVSESVVDEFVFRKTLEKKAEILHNCLDKNEILTMSQTQHAKKYDLCYVGRLTEAKQPTEFVKLVREIIDSGNDVTAVMVGDGNLRKETEALVQSLGLNNNIEIAGFCDNPYKYMASSKIGVLTSAWEGFGLVAVEHMILGLPFLCYPVGGLVDIVNEQNGKLCESTESMKAEIIKLLNDGEYYARKSDCAKRFADRYCDRNTYMEKVVTAYNSML